MSRIRFWRDRVWLRSGISFKFLRIVEFRGYRIKRIHSADVEPVAEGYTGPAYERDSIMEAEQAGSVREEEALLRTLTITLAGEEAGEVHVSLSTLAGKLSAAQAALYNVALARQSSRPAARGNWAQWLRSSCELFFVESRPGSVTVESRLAASEILPGFPDVGEAALHDLGRVLSAVAARNDVDVFALLPDRITRSRALRSIQFLCPRPGEDLTITIGNGVAWAVLSESTRKSITELFQVDAEAEESGVQVITGQLVEIRVKAGTPHIAVLSDRREIECLYPTEMEDLVSQLVAGSFVEVTGRAQLNSDASVKQIDEVFDVATIDVNPFSVQAFRWEGRRFALREPVVCLLSRRAQVWVYECPRFGLLAFSEDRTVALSQLHEEFAFLYDGLADEPDSALTEDAITLRNLLKRDVVDLQGDA